MEPDRFQQNSKLFIVGLISLLLCLTLLAIALFIVPYLIWNWHYGVPAMIIELHEWFRDSYSFDNSGASWMVFLTFFVPAIICGVISQWSSTHIEKEIYGMDLDRPGRRMEIHKEIHDTLSFGLKVIILIVLVILAVSLLHWFVSGPPT
ncbi:MAG: hypothetical protein H0U57_14495 [Tatlockia sp.]|nr:hypothetical protein [Tatlockia sp.]